ncbi:hypothetical protein LXG23DRAFT_52708 [Yarrowia lipolytica]|uniref:Major facilitator superfamily (MFS) profile domain-containing protein n=1 Tax=Yarrowia lipolytica TaxID=4952 RepID=A0A371BXC2_YARLL|nr:hypothetical protein LXG23DRAFT_52708 [Yarrowia lipolytica]RDW22725.1 hypothetical protein B0I71DRAFT_143634 [Yarrowia lipolytica]
MVGAPISRITGSLGVGLLADEYGCKKVTMIPLVLFTFAAVITLSWVIGQFLLIAVITGSESKPNDWPYRIPMAKGVSSRAHPAHSVSARVSMMNSQTGRRTGSSKDSRLSRGQ